MHYLKMNCTVLECLEWDSLVRLSELYINYVWLQYNSRISDLAVYEHDYTIEITSLKTIVTHDIYRCIVIDLFSHLCLILQIDKKMRKNII